LCRYVEIETNKAVHLETYAEKITTTTPAKGL
jgi:hypothetical protein